ncbi:hypothetical protein Adt_45680 [Abeliophyllum distichum]|uniref:P53 and DNA damage-regulated protein 1 n=1 Tax=Abeliophyllum distichum TaxID=126358 RepID=A0ABD1PED1_9LAMI
MSDGRAWDSKKKLRELIGIPGARLPDDTVHNLQLYPALGAQEKIAVEAHRVATKEKKKLNEDSTSHMLEVTYLLEKVEVGKTEVESLKENLEASERGKKRPRPRLPNSSVRKKSWKKSWRMLRQNLWPTFTTSRPIPTPPTTLQRLDIKRSW